MSKIPEDSATTTYQTTIDAIDRRMAASQDGKTSSSNAAQDTSDREGGTTETVKDLDKYMRACTDATMVRDAHRFMEGMLRSGVG